MIARGIDSGKLWRARAWSRPLKWGRDLLAALLYVWRNPYKGGVAGDEDGTYLLDGILQT